MTLSQTDIKKALGKKAAELVERNMLVGLGSGTTSTFFIEALIERCREGLEITAVSSSQRSLEIAKKGGIKVIDMHNVKEIDLTVDGADEIDPQNRMIKGGGGAHVREKILATSSTQLVIVVDESKLVDLLGSFGVPVELLFFGVTATVAKIERLGYKGTLRKDKKGSLYLTDNGNYIYDIHVPNRFPYPEKDHEALISVPGVVDTGFFFNIPLRALVGYKNGQIAFRSSERK